jgi:hypothetical protein
MLAIKNILSSFLSLAILVTTFGIPINYHFCRDRLIDIKLFGQPGPCNEKKVSPIHLCDKKIYCHNQDQDKGCCHNDHKLITLKNIQNTFYSIELLKLFPVSQLKFGSYHFPYTRTFQIFFSFLHDPPFIRTDKVIDFHSFLI